MKPHHESPPDPHALTAAHALDALDADEREAFTAHLAHCAACRRETAEFAATAARLASVTAQAPPAPMKQQVLRAVDGVRQLPPQVSGTVPALLRTRAGRRLPRLVVAASLAVAAALAGLAVQQHREGERAAQRAQQARQQLQDIGAVLAAPDTRTVRGRASNGAHALVAVSPRQDRAVFTAAGLPAAGNGRTYQLWLNRDGAMRPAGFIDRDGTVLVEGATGDARALGLTLEPAGGSPRPTTPPLLLLSLPA
ncbi:anti-sigma factor domain-containing protein [Streptomyces sp. NPDC059816]|uniref:anti-sigma factor n=1 Tax=Streptomyces sp. NPDC059816 TaxID=3346960 RepID=UPI0036574500